MSNNHYMDGFYKFCLMFARLAYLNLLWILFILAGLGVFGLFPSTVAMFTVVRQWVKGNTDAPVFRIFIGTFKKEFIKANLLGVTYLAAGVILYIDILYFSSPSNLGLLILYYFFWVLTGIYLLLGVFLFPVYVHYQARWWHYFKSTLLIMLMNPLVVAAFLLILGCGGVILRALPGLIPLFSGSFMAYALMLVSYKAFNKVEALTIEPSSTQLQPVD
ncbi:putative membrane protein YesL [Bacillus tianshenii]|uniref:Membrane protein YesL n=1 Tax=Sutcliffiella tianshenii TaxID=1463404 RepID=A0ABS2NUY1_9BACI|nr:YesL family protein [Bacillus tianshenii]MBM7618465.1 putative membrane protein YesL [Bacillus tianshenii]